MAYGGQDNPSFSTQGGDEGIDSDAYSTYSFNPDSKRDQAFDTINGIEMQPRQESTENIYENYDAINSPELVAEHPSHYINESEPQHDTLENVLAGIDSDLSATPGPSGVNQNPRTLDHVLAGNESDLSATPGPSGVNQNHRTTDQNGIKRVSTLYKPGGIWSQMKDDLTLLGVRSRETRNSVMPSGGVQYNKFEDVVLSSIPDCNSLASESDSEESDGGSPGETFSKGFDRQNEDRTSLYSKVTQGSDRTGRGGEELVDADRSYDSSKGYRETANRSTCEGQQYKPRPLGPGETARFTRKKTNRIGRANGERSAPGQKEVNSDDSETDQEEEQYPWDLALLHPKPDRGNRANEGWYNFGRGVLRVLMIVIMFLTVLVAGIISVITLLFAATNFRPDIRLLCSQQPSPLTCVSLNVYNDPFFSIGSNDSRSEELISSTESCLSNHQQGPLPVTCRSQMVRWGWCLVLIICVPYLITLCRSLYIMCFKSRCFRDNYPDLKTLIIVLVIEAFQSLGLTLFIFRVLPQLPSAAHGAALLLGTGIIPSIFNLIFSRDPYFDSNPIKSKVLNLVANITALLLQLSALLFWSFMKIIRNDEVLDVTDELAWAIPVSLFLTSLYWWENFIPDKRQASLISRSLSPVLQFTKNVRRYRDMLHLFISLWKVALTILFFVLWSLLDGDDVFAMFDFDASKGNCVDHRLLSDMKDSWVAVWAINTSAAFVLVLFARTAVKTQLQFRCFFLPLHLVIPFCLLFLVGGCSMWNSDRCTFQDSIPLHYFWQCFDKGTVEDVFLAQFLVIFVLWLLSQAIITRRAIVAIKLKLASTASFFSRPMFEGSLLNQFVLYNFNNGNYYDENATINSTGISPEDEDAKVDHDFQAKIFMCGTMWREEPNEMLQLLKSVFRCDVDHFAKNISENKYKVQFSDKYDFEAHIFFDNAMDGYKKESDCYRLNSFVKTFIKQVRKASKELYGNEHALSHPFKYETPYGGRLVWTLLGGNQLFLHLKDVKKIRNKKRWSQIMYLYYSLGYRLTQCDNLLEREDHQQQLTAASTFVLALDGDVDFDTDAILTLVNMMRRNPKLGAACGRIHPVGSGPLVWYQNFEYGIGHWFQKATEHIIGCVLCSPGCFSLFRASALLDENVLKMYASKPEKDKPIQHLQYDQGEDRWLCTLIIQAGWKIGYSSISDSFTFAPMNFGEFYKQRRRWGPSTMANVYDLLTSAKETTKKNDNVSRLYIFYHGILLVTSVFGTGTIFLMLVEALPVATSGAITHWESLFINLVPMVLFSIVLFTADGETQINFAAFLTGTYALLMMIVFIGVIMEIVDQGVCSPSGIFFFMIAGFFLIAAVLHPQEWKNILSGFIYFLLVPCMYMLLMMYSIANLNDISWGTRESPKQEEETDKSKPEDMKGAVQKKINELRKRTGNSIHFPGICQCFLCPKKEDKKAPQEKKKPWACLYPDSHSNEPHFLAEVKGYFAELPQKETQFFEELIVKYLEPLKISNEERDEVADNLRGLRNRASLAFFMMNALFIVMVFIIQRNSDELSFSWICGDGEVRIDPVGILFLGFFGFIMVVQFICMIIHRFGSLKEVVVDRKNNSKNSKDLTSFITQALQINPDLNSSQTTGSRITNYLVQNGTLPPRKTVFRKTAYRPVSQTSDDYSANMNMRERRYARVVKMVEYFAGLKTDANVKPEYKDFTKRVGGESKAKKTAKTLNKKLGQTNTFV